MRFKYIILASMVCMGLMVATSPAAQINIVPYWAAGTDGDYWTYTYIQYPFQSLNFPGQPDLTVTLNLETTAPYVGVYRLGDYYFPNYYTGNQRMYITWSVDTLVFYGDEQGPFPTPRTLPGIYDLDTVIPQPGGTGYWYFLTQPSLTVPAGTYYDILVHLNLDPNPPFTGPTAVNTYFGINVPYGVTHANWYARGVGEIMNMDFDEHGNLLFTYVLKDTSVSAIPLPGSLVLLASGLPALARWRRRQ